MSTARRLATPFLIAALAAAVVSFVAPAAASDRDAPPPAIPLTIDDIDRRYMDDDLDPSLAALLRDAIGHALPAFDGEGLRWFGSTGSGRAGGGAPPDTAGEIVVVQSWSIEDPRSRSVPTRVARLIESSGAKGVTLVALHTPIAEKRLERYLDRRDHGFAVALDRTGAWCDNMGVFESPTTIIADRDGRIRLAGASAVAVARAVKELGGESERTRASLPEAKPLPDRDDRVEALLEQTYSDAARERLRAGLARLRFNPDPEEEDSQDAGPSQRNGGAGEGDEPAPVTEGIEAIAKNLGSRLRNVKGEAFDPLEHLRGKEFVLLYNSAGWCGPCRAFTPSLVDFYNSSGGGERFEVVLISHDRSTRDAVEYMRDADMPWTMVEASDVPRVRSYRTGRGIPDLVLLDGETGEVIKTSYTDAGRFTGPTAVLEETERRLGE